ncbi:MAG TPA: hypothetical protein VLG28_15350 [Acidimicrobiia bacterium]|jgi:Mrp family chromosome partitioning ATPase|nr:hypothetical protein [Acidimicrobiia bacterium]
MNNADASQFEPGVLPSIWRYRWLFLLVVVGFVALGYLSSLLQPSDNNWSASSVLVVEDPRASALFDTAPQSTRGRYVANQVAVLRSTPVAESSSEMLTEQGIVLSPEEVLESYEVIAATGNSEVIEIIFYADGEAAAIGGANVIAEAYQEVRRSEARSNYQSSIDQLDAFIATTDTRLAELQGAIDASLDTSVSGSLQDRYDEAIAELLALQARPTANADDIDALNAEIAALQNAITFGASQSEIDLLVQEQQNLLARRAQLTQQRDEILIDSELLGSGVLLFSPAASATAPAQANPMRNTALGLVVGLALGAIAAYFLALRRRTFSDAAQPSRILESPLLASVPLFKEERITSPLPILDAPASEAAEGFRFTVASLRHRFAGPARYPDGTVAAGPGANTPWIAFVSAAAGDGKTVVTANTALAAAGDGHRVLLIDADIADQDLTRIMREHSEGPITLQTPTGRAMSGRVIAGAHSGVLHMISLRDSGEATDVARLVGEVLPLALSTATSQDYDFVFIDVPPLLQIAYAGTIASQAGTALVVVPHGGRAAELEEEKSRLDLSSTAIAGYVYNKAPRRTEGAVPGSSLLAHRSALRGAPAAEDWSEVVEIGREVKEQHDAAHGS